MRSSWIIPAGTLEINRSSWFARELYAAFVGSDPHLPKTWTNLADRQNSGTISTGKPVPQMSPVGGAVVSTVVTGYKDGYTLPKSSITGVPSSLFALVHRRNVSQYGYHITTGSASMGLTNASVITLYQGTFRYTGTIPLALNQAYTIATSTSHVDGYFGYLDGVLDGSDSPASGWSGTITKLLGGSPNNYDALSLALGWTRFLTAEEHAELAENPWQLFRVVRPVKVFLPSSATSFVPAWAAVANTVISNGARTA